MHTNEDRPPRQHHSVAKEQYHEQQDLTQLEPTITAHLDDVDYYKQRILLAIESKQGDTKQSLAASLHMEDWAFDGHWKKLVSWGMIIEEKNGTVTLHPLISSYLQQVCPVPLTSSMKTIVINPTTASFTRPVFDSQQEYKLYTLLLEMFHGQLVFPHMALQTIFPYAKMQDVLSQEEFNYYLLSHVDICITRTTSYFPLVAFEVDGPAHTQEEHQRKDALKNTIFAKGGLGLIRFQIDHQPFSTKELWDEVRETIHHALSLWRSDTTRKGWVDAIEKELGVSHFEDEA